jgi:CheY-like chemotaxis protein
MTTNAQSRTEPLSVLLLEDNETDIFVIQEALKRCDFDFTLDVARNGEEALQYIGTGVDPKDHHPDLLLLDLNVPKVPGIEVLREVRSRPGHVPVVVVTSSDSEEDRRAVGAFGVEAYFRKPSDLKTYMNLAQVVMDVLPPHAHH